MMNKIIKMMLVYMMCCVGEVLYGIEVEPLNPFSMRNDTKNIFELERKLIPREEKPLIPEGLVIPKEPILTPEQVHRISEPTLVKSKVEPKPLDLRRKTQPRKKEITPPKEIMPPKEEITQPHIMPPQKVVPSPRAEPVSVVVKEPQRIRKDQIVNLVLWSIFSLVSISLFGLYLQRRHRLAQRSLFDVAVLYKQPHLRDELRQLRIGYRGLERVVKEIEESIEPLRQLGSRSIVELTREFVNQNTQQINNAIGELKDFYKNLTDEVHKIDKRLSVIDEIKGKSLKEFIHEEINRCTNGWDRSVRDDLTHHMNLDKQLFSQLSEKVDRRIDDIYKQTQEITKEIKEIVSRLDELELAVSSGNTFGLPKKRPKQRVKIEETGIMDRLHNQIYSLADEGLSVDDIAQRVSLGKAEVRLILDLRKPEVQEEQ